MNIASKSPHVTRRGLVAAGAGAVGALTLGRSPAGAQAAKPAAALTDAVGTNLPPNRIGIQMYSVRDQPALMGGMPAVLTALHEIGYRTVEFAGINVAEIPKIKSTLADLDMVAVGNHGALNQASLDTAVALGLPYTGIGSIPTGGLTMDAWKQTAEQFNTFGEAAAARGVKFYAHMHQELFYPVVDAPGTYALDVMLANTDPGLVFFEMDIYWAYTAAWNEGGGMLFEPSDWVVAHPKRFPLFHVKDGHYATRQGGATVVYNQDNAPQPLQDGMTDVHQGDIDFRTFFSRLAKVSDLENHHFLWERDSASSHPHGSLSSARASYHAMRSDHLAGPSRY
jgi:sugar phosphate isomerase/epimerase